VLLFPDGWYLVASKEKSQAHRGQLRIESAESLAKLGECSWSGQSGSEKRDEKAPELLVRDIGVAQTSAADVYNKRAKLYTYDPPQPEASADAGRKLECVHRGLKLLCVHDKRKYNKKPPTPASGSAAVAPKSGNAVVAQKKTSAAVAPKKTSAAVAPKKTSAPRKKKAVGVFL
jgi:hypothetical protein